MSQDSDDHPTAAALMIEQIERALTEPGVDTQKLVRARSLAAEAARTPPAHTGLSCSVTRGCSSGRPPRADETFDLA
jgi:hypothetical protein